MASKSLAGLLAPKTNAINVGGFSDHVFQLVADVAGGRFSQKLWVNEIRQSKRRLANPLSWFGGV